VRAAERADPDCAAFPRGKPHDDASVVYLEFSSAAADRTSRCHRSVR
jgi:hypothetical protein